MTYPMNRRSKNNKPNSEEATDSTDLSIRVSKELVHEAARKKGEEKASVSQNTPALSAGAPSAAATANERGKKRRFARKEHRPVVVYGSGPSTQQFYRQTNGMPPVKQARLSGVSTVIPTATAANGDDNGMNGATVTGRPFPPVSIMPGSKIEQINGALPIGVISNATPNIGGLSSSAADKSSDAKERFHAALERYHRLTQATSSLTSSSQLSNSGSQSLSRPNTAAVPATTSVVVVGGTQFESPTVWNWKLSEVIQWLLTFPTGKLYIEQFARANVNGFGLANMDDARLTALGIYSEGHRQELMARIAVLKPPAHKTHTPTQLPNQGIPAGHYRCFYCHFSNANRFQTIKHMSQFHNVTVPVVAASHGQSPNHSRSPAVRPLFQSFPPNMAPPQQPRGDLRIPDLEAPQKHGTESISESAEMFDPRTKRLVNHYIPRDQRGSSNAVSSTSKGNGDADEHSSHSSSDLFASTDRKTQGSSFDEDRHGQSGGHRCLICQRDYSSQSYLKKHMASQHPTELGRVNPKHSPHLKTVCDACGQSFPDQLSFLLHVAEAHQRPGSGVSPSSAAPAATVSASSGMRASLAPSAVPPVIKQQPK